MQRAIALVQGMRPRQWLKNVLVIAAPLASGAIFDPANIPLVGLAFVTFCLGSSSIYLLNDLLDRKLDREHPKKQLRPIASGRLPVPLALVALIILAAAAIALPLVFDEPGLALVMAVYLAVQVAYCAWLKNTVVIDLVLVSSGFLLRAIAGAVVLDLALSQWFLLVAAFGSLFMVAGKRFSEKVAEHGSAATRPTMAKYTPDYLRSVWTIGAGVLMLSYALWAFELGDESSSGLEMLSIVPFTVAVLRYAFDVDGGRAESPESAVLKDPVLLILGLVWVATFGASVLLR